MPAKEESLKGYQRKYLRSRAHSLKPVLLIGQRGVTDLVRKAFEEALDRHELIKIKFVEDNAKTNKDTLIEMLRKAAHAHFVGMVGHTAIFFRQNPDKEKQKIELPRKPTDADASETGEDGPEI